MNETICPCDTEVWPNPVANPSGLPSIRYRVGDFAGFRHALVQHLPGEMALACWQPSSGRDLALQVVDWWSYLADILTFYNERIANEDYLSTAVLPESVSRLVGLLGYRPRPGIGAAATLAVLATRPLPLVLPAGLAIGSKAGPGQQAQTFELGRAVTFDPPTSVPGGAPDTTAATASPTSQVPPPAAAPGAANPPGHSQLLVRGGVLLKGKVSGVGVGDRLLLLPRSFTSADADSAVVAVSGLVAEKDSYGQTNTRVLVDGAGSLAAAQAADYRLVRPTTASHLATVPTGATVVTGTTLVLDSTARSLKAGDPLLLELPGALVGATPGSGFDLLRLTGYEELVWYANALPTTPLVALSDTGIPLLVAQLTVTTHSGTNLAAYQGQVTELVLRSGWVDVGTLLDTPFTTLASVPTTVTLAQPPTAAAGVGAPAVLEDAEGRGAVVTATPTAGTSDVAIGAPAGALLPASGAGRAPAFLVPPLRLLWDVITVTRGKTVANEAVGQGDATVAGQDFTLSQSPVTYLSDPSSRSGDNYSSTVVVNVNGIFWSEVTSFYGQEPDATVFVTREDDQGKTHVVFGDGVNGARLPSGTGVTATYRVGSGAAVPDAGALSTLLTPVPNLSSVRNPAPAEGGSDPDPPDQLRRYAPRSVLTFGRAVSGDDYQTVAAMAPGVDRAAAVWAWDPGEQRSLVRVFVGDTDGAVASARQALREQADPNRPLVVLEAIRHRAALDLTLEVDPSHAPTAAVVVVRAQLIDPDHGVFATSRLGIGEVLYRSQIELACMVPGVLAVHHLRLTVWDNGQVHHLRGHRFDPGDGGYFDLAATDLAIRAEAQDA